MTKEQLHKALNLYHELEPYDRMIEVWEKAEKFNGMNIGSEKDNGNLISGEGLDFEVCRQMALKYYKEKSAQIRAQFEAL